MAPSQLPTATVPATLISDDQVNQVAHQLYCPICQNISLDVCGTQACAGWRELIRQKLAAGWNDRQIIDYFATQYGDQVLPEPPMAGINWLAYLLPAASILLVIGISLSVVQNLRQNKNKPRQISTALQLDMKGETQDPYLNRLEDELRKLHQGKR